MKSSEATSYKLIERPIYGSSRVGIDTRQGVAGNTQLELIGYTAPTSGILTNVLGLKQYEFSNLSIAIGIGNVLTTVSDKKIPVDVGNDGTIDYYVADITSASDYYPFGSPLDGRTFSSDKYRFGFNGKEKDDEVKGGGAQYDYGFRIYDSRLGRFLSVDPLTKSYPWYTPYQFAGNNPIWAIDLDGLEEKVEIGKNTFEIQATYVCDQKVLDNVNVYELQIFVNNTLNENPTNIMELVKMQPIPCNDGYSLSQPEPLLKVTFNYKISDSPITTDELNNKKGTRIRACNGPSLGGRIKMGSGKETEFQETEIPGTNSKFYTFAMRDQNTGDIILNPKVYEGETYTGEREGLYADAYLMSNKSKYGIISHELGEDLGLKHDKYEYPDTGLMQKKGGPPTKQEIEQIVSPKNPNVTNEAQDPDPNYPCE